MPRLSVLLPVRNGGRFLGSALGSTLRALPRDAELVVCDDGSEDGTVAVLDKASADPRLRVLRNDVGQGVAAALNRLLDESDSEFVARMDADDLCLPWRFLRFTEQMRKTELLFAPVLNVDARLRPTSPDLPGAISSSAVPLHLMLGNVLRHPTMLASRVAVEKLGGYRSDVAAEDYDLWLRALAAGLRIRRTALPVLLYREHPAQVTRAAAWNSTSEQQRFEELYSMVFTGLFGSTPRTELYASSALAGRPEALPVPWRTELRSRISTAARCLGAGDQALLQLKLRALG